jgi:glycosyltransferase involved in cell wall biosynthesis
MFCSVIIPTIGRQSVSRAVHSVLDQTFTADRFEVVVVNDSGQPLPLADWQQSQQVRVITTNRRERSVARNTGAAVARGKYLCFLDDDDWLLPDALEHFWRLAQQSNDADWLLGGIQIVDETGKCLAEANSGLNGNCFAQVMGGAWAPIQASLIRADVFFNVGGYNPSICGTEDLDLCRRVALRGEFASTRDAVACLFRGMSWDTSTDYLRAPEDTLQSRDDVLSQADSFSRMLVSARSSSYPSYWYGRIFRVYLSTARLNWRRRKLFAATSRALLGMAGFVLAGQNVLLRSFWNAAKAHHAPNTLHFIMRALEEGDNSNPG